MKRDLTTGSIKKNLLYMAMPAIMGQMARTLYDIVDMFWIGKISAQAVAGVTVFTTILFLVWVLSSIIGSSSVSLISQSFGAGDKAKTSEVIEQTITFKALVAFITMIIIFPILKPLVSFLTDDPEVIALALRYGTIRLMFLPVMFSSVTMSTALRCVGDSKKPMYIMLMSSVMNIVLDPILMFEQVPILGIRGFGMGVYGAALATCLSGLAALILGLYYLLSGKSNIRITLRGLFKLNPEIDKKLMLIGLPIGFEMIAREGAGFLIIKLLSVFGTSVIAGVGITFRVIGLAFTMMVGLGDGAGTIVGQNLGAGNVPRADQTAKTAAGYGFIATSILFVGALVYAPQIINLFVQDPDVIRDGAIMLRMMTFGCCFISIGFGLGSAFSGSGYTKPFMYSSFIARWLVQLPWLWVTTSVLHLPFFYAAIGYAVAEIAESSIMAYIYFRGSWKEHRVVEKSIAN